MTKQEWGPKDNNVACVLHSAVNPSIYCHRTPPTAFSKLGCCLERRGNGPASSRAMVLAAWPPKADQNKGVWCPNLGGKWRRMRRCWTLEAEGRGMQTNTDQCVPGVFALQSARSCNSDRTAVPSWKKATGLILIKHKAGGALSKRGEILQEEGGCHEGSAARPCENRAAIRSQHKANDIIAELGDGRKLSRSRAL